MIFLFARWLKFCFQTNHPTASEQKNGREINFFGLLSEISPIDWFSAKPHLVGNTATLYATYSGDKKNFQKSYGNDIPKKKSGKNRTCVDGTGTYSPL
jgi:hypothetical protein